MSALDDTKTFLDTASPDAKKLGDVAYIYAMMVILVKGHELANDSEEVKVILSVLVISMLLMGLFGLFQFVRGKIQKADSVAHYFGRPIPKTGNRLAALMLLDLRSSSSCTKWLDVIADGTARARKDTTMPSSKANDDSPPRDDLEAWLVKDADNPEAEGQYIMHADNRIQPADGGDVPSWGQSELYRCSWCRNPSAVLQKCRNCGKVRCVSLLHISLV